MADDVSPLPDESLPIQVAEPSFSEAASLSASPRVRSRLRPLEIGILALFGAVAILFLAVSYFGSAEDGYPSVSLKLVPRAGAAGEAPVKAAALRAPRLLNGHPIADPAVLADDAGGVLPVIASDGRTPMQIYARAFDAADKRPRIAIVVGGLGVSETATESALSHLPPDVTLGFAPFAPDVQAWADKARAAGHELLLDVPMEPFDFPDSDPGPHTLLVTASSEENGKRLDWALGRFTGYVGIGNLLGGRFLGEGTALDPIAAQIAKRGLIFFDDGANARSLLVTSARHAHAAIATGTLVLDSVQSQAAIDEKLAALETEARANGFAIGVGSPYPVTIARIAAWSATAAANGFALAPISALAAVPMGDDVEEKPQTTASAER
jgi:polysaccharide deacetylase 2 family uncharacterized protein YibQ